MALAKPNFERTDLRSSTANRNTWLAAGLLITALAAWCALVWATPWLPASIDLQVPQVARTLSAGLFLAAGVLWLVRWWLTDDQQSARTGAAFILLGLALPVVALVGPLMQSPPNSPKGSQPVACCSCFPCSRSSRPARDPLATRSDRCLSS